MQELEMRQGTSNPRDMKRAGCMSNAFLLKTERSNGRSLVMRKNGKGFHHTCFLDRGIQSFAHEIPSVLANHDILKSVSPNCGMWDICNEYIFHEELPLKTLRLQSSRHLI